MIPEITRRHSVQNKVSNLAVLGNSIISILKSHTDLKCFQELGMTSQESHSQLVPTVAENVELIGHQWSSNNLANFSYNSSYHEKKCSVAHVNFQWFSCQKTCVFRLFLEQNITNKLPISNITRN